MKTHVDYTAITTLFKSASRDNRDHLFEYEVYDLIRYAGSETPPHYVVLPQGERLHGKTLQDIPGDRLVIKIISPFILHKSDVGGVRIVSKTLEEVLSAIRSMYYEIPARFYDLVEKGKFMAPRGLAGLTSDKFAEAIKGSIAGVVLCQYMHPDSQEFGNELLVSLRKTREFGMILSAGLGGTDTELYAQRFRKGQAVVAASTEMVDGAEFFTLFKQTISYKKLAGLTRSQKRIVTDEQLLECFSAFIEIGNFYSPLNSSTSHVIEELEINPFAFSNYLMMPLDGLCRFSPQEKATVSRPVKNVDRMLHPKKIGIAGVSAKGRNIGRIILENITGLNFPSQAITLIHPYADEIEGILPIRDLKELQHKLDLLILAVNSEAIPEMVDIIFERDLAYGVVIIPGGFGVYDNQERLMEKFRSTSNSLRLKGMDSPVFLGGNSLGILSRPGKYDALFIPETKLPKSKGKHVRKSALVSQSGAYMITRMSKLSFLDPAYAVSMGNQIDLTAADVLSYFKDVPDLETIAYYIEGFADLDGLAFCQAVRGAQQSAKEIIFYKAGRTAEGKTAMSGHTASIAGDYMVCETCIEQAGAFVAETFSEFEGLLRLSRALYSKKISGRRLAAVSNAGYEAVGMADNILGDNFSFQIAEFSDNSVDRVGTLLADKGLAGLVSVSNPLDVTPMADEEVYEAIIKILLEDDTVDLIIVAIVPLTPLLHTLPDEYIEEDQVADGNGIVGRIVALNGTSRKPIVMVVDSGPLYDHMAQGLEQGGLAVFRSADHAVRTLGKYVHQRLKTNNDAMVFDR